MAGLVQVLFILEECKFGRLRSGMAHVDSSKIFDSFIFYIR